MGTFVELQALGGDVEGARQSARQGRSWYPFARVAIAQQKAGDLKGAIETTRMVPTSMGQAQALGYLSSSMPLDEGLALARTIEWPKQQIEALRSASRDLFRSDTARSMAVLREAIAVAQRDTSFWGRYFDVELAYDQAERGDLRGALRILADTLGPADRAERLARIARELQRAPTPRAGPIADSLFREALRAADALADTTRRTSSRARVFWLYIAYADAASVEVALSESRTAAERASVLERGVYPREPVSRGSLTDQQAVLLDRIRELEVLGQFRAAAEAIPVAISRRLYEGIRRPPSAAQPSSIDSLVRRAVDDADRVDRRFADSTKLRLVRLFTERAPSTARALAEAIADSTLRVQAMLTVARQLLDSDPAGAFAYASAIPSRSAQDSLLAIAAARRFLTHPDSAIALARRISAPPLRGMTLLGLAKGLAESADFAAARELALEGMRLTVPLEQPLEPSLLGPLVRGGLYDVVLQWARSQSAPEARALAFFALFGSIASR